MPRPNQSAACTLALKAGLTLEKEEQIRSMHDFLPRIGGELDGIRRVEAVVVHILLALLAQLVRDVPVSVIARGQPAQGVGVAGLLARKYSIAERGLRARPLRVKVGLRIHLDHPLHGRVRLYTERQPPIRIMQKRHPPAWCIAP